MTVEVMLTDGTTIYPSYDPEHRQSVLEFYASRFEQGLIMAWKVI